jgi:hypothetical protein
MIDIKEVVQTFLGQLFPFLLEFLAQLFAWLPTAFR